MKFFNKSRGREKTILFVCVENAGRSQMAEGFFNRNPPKGYRAISAGTKPLSQINRIAVDVMREIGIDISHQHCKDITEVLASALLMAVILAVVYTKGLKGFSGIAIGGIVGLDILFFSYISGASMNPARSLAPALLSGYIGDLWLYWSATFVGTSTVALLLREKFRFLTP
jgi:glycerol uptake facilitator-like aquaporin